ncbi:caspase-1-A-like isoform X2 [Pyxicephalus adspersus]|uniref:caspase-1-A-like isoform X2 n=1 Tax=Pyxicephalus adspersus TaxID=30357 RepID=UPI003B5A71C6
MAGVPHENERTQPGAAYNPRGCNRTLINSLLDELLNEKILTNREVDDIDEGIKECSKKMQVLVDTVWKKGKKSSLIMIQTILKRDPMLSETLGISVPTELPLPKEELKGGTASQSTPSNFPLPTQEQKIEPPRQTEPSYSSLPAQEPTINGIRLCSKEDYESISLKEHDKIYSILSREKRTRLALIICNVHFTHLDKRSGAKHDVDGMEKLLEGLGYRVRTRTNLTAEDMLETINSFAREKEHETSDSTFLVFSSHGLKDVICGTDTEVTKNENSGQEEVKNVLPVDKIFHILNNQNCPALRDKPKAIIIQACRGHDNGKVWVNDSALPSVVQENLEADSMRKIQRESDFICFYSTTPDTVSVRDPQNGSLFILRLIEHMKNDAYRYSVEKIFRNVQLSFKDQVQMPTLERTTLLKKFYLFPGQ